MVRIWPPLPTRSAITQCSSLCWKSSTLNAVTSDRAANFNEEVVSTIKSFGIQPKRTSFRNPWQNGVAERFVGNCRRDLLDHVIVLNERHLNPRLQW